MGAPNDIRTPYRVGKVIVSNERGLHARAAAKFVKLAATFDADVTVAKNETEVPGGSIMALMMLAAGPGCELEVRARGREAAAAVVALTQLVMDRFHEE